MSWVSQANLKSIMTAIRNKFTTGDLVIANDAKDTGVELNHTAQDGLVTVSPISTDASVESALHLSNGDDTKKTELTQGTLSYVTGTGDSEEYNYMSLLGDGVTFGKKGGGNVQVGGVADPTSAQQVATKNYVDGKILTKHNTVIYPTTTSSLITLTQIEANSVYMVTIKLRQTADITDFNKIYACGWFKYGVVTGKFNSFPFFILDYVPGTYPSLKGLLFTKGDTAQEADITGAELYASYLE